MNVHFIALRAALTHPATLSCPFCGEDPGLARQVNGVFLVGCENDECAAGPQVAGMDQALAWTKWNRRAAR